jgi:hypothetical protein
MNPRRIVESFGSPRWTQQSDSRMCALDVKVNGEREAFHLVQAFSKTIRAPVAHYLGRSPWDQDLEAIAKARIEELVPTGYLDDWPPSLALTLPPIDDRNLGMLIGNARQEGWIR